MKRRRYFLSSLALALLLGHPSSNVNAAPAEDNIDVRQDHILGKPPRIPRLAPDQYSADAQQIIDDTRRAVGAEPTTGMADYFATMLHHPKLMERQLQLSIQLFTGELSTRHRELAILRVAWLNQAPYEWGEHVLVGKREAGLTSEEIERVTQGPAAPGWASEDRAILKAVDELHADAMISDETWATLAETLSYQQLIELPVLVGIYQGTAYLQNSLRIPLMKHNEGLMAR